MGSGHNLLTLCEWQSNIFILALATTLTFQKWQIFIATWDFLLDSAKNRRLADVNAVGESILKSFILKFGERKKKLQQVVFGSCIKTCIVKTALHEVRKNFKEYAKSVQNLQKTSCLQSPHSPRIHIWRPCCTLIQCLHT